MRRPGGELRVEIGVVAGASADRVGVGEAQRAPMARRRAAASRRSRGSRRGGPGAPSSASAPSRRAGRSRTRSPRARSEAAWRRSASRAGSPTPRGRARRRRTTRSSSTRTRTIRAAFSASGPGRVELLDLARLHPAPPRRSAVAETVSGDASAVAARLAGGGGELVDRRPRAARGARGSTGPASASFASSCSALELARSATRSRAGRDAASPPRTLPSISIATSRSRRSPSASASVLDLARAPPWPASSESTAGRPRSPRAAAARRPACRGRRSMSLDVEDVLGVIDQLLAADLEDPRRDLAVGEVGAQARDLPCLGHGGSLVPGGRPAG